MLEGDVVAGRYRLERVLGQGGSGAVWQAEDQVLGRRVALKIVADAAGRDPQVLERMEREARLAAGFSEASVVQLYDILEVDGLPVLVMELLPGGSLAGRLATGGRLAPAHASVLVSAVARALARAHDAGVLHRDVKPGNILLDRDGNPKLADFGLALAGGDDRLTSHGSVVGTVGYLAPELFQGAEPSPATDVWALGVTYVELLTGRAPFDGPGGAVGTMQRIAHGLPDLTGVPDSCEAVALGMLERDPQRRLAAGEAAARLLDVASRPLDGAGQATTAVIPLLPAAAEGGEPRETVPGAGDATVTLAPSPATRADARSSASTPLRRDRRVVAATLAALLALGGIGLAVALLNGSEEGGGGVAAPAGSPDVVASTEAPSATAQTPAVTEGAGATAGETAPTAGTVVPPPTSPSSDGATLAPAPSAPGGTSPGAPTTSRTAGGTPTTSAPATTSGSPTTPPAPAPTDYPPEDQKAFLTQYFRTARTNPQEGWKMLSPLQQSREGGYAGYEARWRDITDVASTITRWNHMVMLVTNRYTLRSGGTRLETLRYRLEVTPYDGRLRVQEIG